MCSNDDDDLAIEIKNHKKCTYNRILFDNFSFFVCVFCMNEEKRHFKCRTKENERRKRWIMWDIQYCLICIAYWSLDPDDVKICRLSSEKEKREYFIKFFCRVDPLTKMSKKQIIDMMLWEVFRRVVSYSIAISSNMRRYFYEVLTTC